jgi:hypothetical protein
MNQGRLFSGIDDDFLTQVREARQATQAGQSRVDTKWCQAQ